MIWGGGVTWNYPQYRLYHSLFLKLSWFSRVFCHVISGNEEHISKPTLGPRASHVPPKTVSYIHKTAVVLLLSFYVGQLLHSVQMLPKKYIFKIWVATLLPVIHFGSLCV